MDLGFLQPMFDHATEILAATLILALGKIRDTAMDAPIQRAIDSRLRVLKRVQRVKWPDDKRVFEKSWKTIYREMPEDILDPKARLEAFLREDAETENAEEVWLVARRRGRIRAILYASVLPPAPHRPIPQTYVWAFGADPELPDETAVELGRRLWEDLIERVEDKFEKELRQKNYGDIYVQMLDLEDDELDEDEIGWGRRYLALLAEVGAKRLDFPFIIADSQTFDVEEEIEGHLYYFGREMSPKPKADLLDNVYSFLYWDFIYGVESPRLRDLKDRADYFDDVVGRVSARTAGELIGFADDDAARPPKNE